ncbi:MAG: choice-of-anchor O protein [Anaerolineales bacterium]
MNKKLRTIFILVIAAIFLMSGIAQAEDGALFRRNISKTPDAETEKAAIYMMDFYVPAQSSAGVVGPVDNYILDDDAGSEAYEPRDYAKPLVAVYIDEIGHPEIPEDEYGIAGGLILGEFDAFAAVSLDDGTSWKRTNISRSADLSSFILANGQPYMGGVPNVVHQVAGDQIFIAWISKYCDGGTPLYKLGTEPNFAENVDYFADLEETYGKDAVYLYDLFGVNGQQASVDYTEQGHPDVGEIPYSCVWTARGKLIAGDDPNTGETEATHVVWTKPERLTSGTRDANLPAVDCAMGAGCVLTWQEDPEGLRPGQGLGPGEGWSGAIANGKTDIWYSYISYADFDLVFDTDGTVAAPLTMAEYALLSDATMPKPYVPMAMPVRLTDNNMCKGASSTLNPSDPYCYIDFDDLENLDPLDLPEEPTEGSTFCASQIDWTTPGGSTIPICVAEDGRVLNGRVASTRVRLNLKPYTKADGTISAWVVMAAEETKALGDQLVDPYGNPAEDPLDIGKDVWYYSFDMFDHVIVDQGGMLNQPAKCSPWTVGADYECDEYEFFPVQTDPLNGGEFYLTEISRRFALTTNSVSTIAASDSGLSAILIYKQGIINQGGPADIMLRRTVVDPATFNPAVDNPYAYENMECDEWVYTDGSNPNYLKGLCLSPAINISGTTIVECSGGTGNDACAATFPVADDGSIPGDINKFPKVLEWRQCDGTDAIEGCEDDNDLDDQTWENPFDVAKGHRGFVDGDFVMIMYAWSPNWKANAVGNDHYNLYIRRSFDGGLTWTTTPAALGGTGTSATENYCVETSAVDCEGTEFVYGAGDFEQARNVSQLTGNKITILDPRYSPTGGLKLYPSIRTDWLTYKGFTFEGLPYIDDATRDPTIFFMVYETGDNTTVAEGEAVPLNLYYSRATVYGDVWELDPDWYDEDTGEILDYRWPWLENKKDDLSGEASMLANPGGTFMYAVWNQWKEDILPDGEEHIYDSDIIFRRVLYLPGDSTVGMAIPPKMSIAYASHVYIPADDTLVTFAGSAKLFTNDKHIVAWKWRSSLDGELGNQQILTMRGYQLSIGQHTLYVTAQDSTGLWGKEAAVPLQVGSKIFMPVVSH